MIRTALDSDDVNAFTTNVDFIFTYSDLITNPGGYEARWPGQQVVYIDRGHGDPGLKATVADVESGLMTPAQLPAWFDERFDRGMKWLTHYSSRDTLPAIAAAIGKRVMWQWVATLDGTVAIPGFKPVYFPSIIQILPASKIGIHADFSLVLDPNWRPAVNSNALAEADRDLAAAVSALQGASGNVEMARRAIALAAR